MALLQTSFFPEFTLTRVKPDLVLLFVISVGLLKGYREGVAVGLVAGFITGVISWNLWGLYMLAYCLAGFAAGMVPEKVDPDNFFIVLISGAVGSLGYAVIFTSIGILFDLYYIVMADIYKLLIFLLWNTIFIIPIFYLSKNILIPPGLDIDLAEAPKKSTYTIE